MFILRMVYTVIYCTHHSNQFVLPHWSLCFLFESSVDIPVVWFLYCSIFYYLVGELVLKAAPSVLCLIHFLIGLHLLVLAKLCAVAKAGILSLASFIMNPLIILLSTTLADINECSAACG